jgi:GT2 family glycosyltransferase
MGMETAMKKNPSELAWDGGSRELLASPATANPGEPADPFPATLVLTPTSRWPTRLPPATVQAVLGNPLPRSRAYPVSQPPQAGIPRASIVIVTFNNLVYTRLCLESLLANTDYPHHEIIVVDNGSTDGTPDYLRSLAGLHPHIQVVLNGCNRGFAPANNQGLALARGDHLVLLNNDTLVPHSWLNRLVRDLEDRAIGLVGPVTNRTGNEAQIEVSYQTYGEFKQFSRDYYQSHGQERFDIRMLAMFCVAMRRDVYECIGPLDERFEVGLFEDEDYAMRVRAAGYRVVCAEDVFIHHFGQASIGELARAGAYGELFHANRRRWEEKWRTPWQPYQRRPNLAYQRLTERIRKVVAAAVPPDATVLVVSKGDEELLQLAGRTAWHFPQGEDGSYAGHHPADSAAAIAHLEALRDKGADFLLLPETARWWLQHYAEFGQYLDSRCWRIRCDGCCLLFNLSGVTTDRTDIATRTGHGGRLVSQGREERISDHVDAGAAPSGKE